MMRNYHPDPPSDDGRGYGVLDIKVWLFTRDYPHIIPSALFSAISASISQVPFFKVWKVNNDERYINLTTHSIKLNPKLKYHQVEVDLQVVEGKDPSSSVVNFRIVPTLTGIVSQYELFTNVDVNDKFAKYIADLVFGAIEKGHRRF
jgi:hypothetical protein